MESGSENSKLINQSQNNIWSTKVLQSLNSSKINFENISFTDLDINFKLKICKNEKINSVIILKSSNDLLNEILINSLKNIQLPTIPNNLRIQLENKCKTIPYVFHVVGNTNNYQIN